MDQSYNTYESRQIYLTVLSWVYWVLCRIS